MRRLRIRSVPEFLELRYSGPLRVLVAAFWGLRLSVFMGILLYLAGTVAVQLTGIDFYFGWLLVFCAVAIIYSVIGGAWAVAIMDSVLFVVTLIGGLILLPVAMYYAGGMPQLWQWLQANPHLAHPQGLSAYRAGGVSQQAGDTDRADAAAEAAADTFHLIPASLRGRAFACVVLAGFATFLFGVVSAAWASPLAGEMAIGGTLAVLAGGLGRVYSE